ncbi:MAG: hypothetical protein IJZ72_07260 [Oscillospiraceae bacterium]|nr:hypothetical protein [Oscillospiraceae bacterium]
MNKLIEIMVLIIICTVPFNKSILPDYIHKNEIIVGEYEISSTAAGEKYDVSTEAACDKIMDTGICPSSCKFLCSGIARTSNEDYYVIDSISEKGDIVTKECTFWVQCDSGEVYVYFDPTLHYSDFYDRFRFSADENDGRSRLIKIS